ncbi:MAG: sulfotransferase [Chromatiaceae bacterium]|nr:sulfotransferase [Gammaproteobacteria bacterium]MCP5426846.1 sulfotransferase [Chromatiaceae bacterium]MCP5446641.1 sulfotransferase [Chromatiaceae bacterium]
MTSSIFEQGDDHPVFVRGLSRSGGTLLVTLLDAHPQIAMSYELYPTLLEGDVSDSQIEEVAKKLINARSQKDALKAAPYPGFRTFIARADRGGLHYKRLGELVLEHLSAGKKLSKESDRLQLIAACCREKMMHEAAQCWGLKCNNNYDAYLSEWPGSRFINIIRDGRDVLASQMNTGAFAKEPAKLGQSWANTHRRFREFKSAHPDLACEVKYEALVTSPETELRKLTTFLGVPFSPNMLRHANCNLTLFKSSHLSMDEVRQPVNTKKIGRWRTDLSKTVVQQFVSVAGDALREFGYEV